MFWRVSIYYPYSSIISLKLRYVIWRVVLIGIWMLSSFWLNRGIFTTINLFFLNVRFGRFYPVWEFILPWFSHNNYIPCLVWMSRGNKQLEVWFYWIWLKQFVFIFKMWRCEHVGYWYINKTRLGFLTTKRKSWHQNLFSHTWHKQMEVYLYKGRVQNNS